MLARAGRPARPDPGDVDFVDLREARQRQSGQGRRSSRREGCTDHDGYPSRLRFRPELQQRGDVRDRI